MTYKLLTRKLYLDEKKFIESNLIREYCEKLVMDYYPAIRYLTHNKYLIRILRGIFYKPSVEERKFNKLDVNYLYAINEALKIKNVKNRYFGLETAIKLNNLTHEYFVTDYVVNDKIFRAKPIMILGHKIRFIKLKKGLFKFGIKKNNIPFSDVEKTILDIVYLSKYDGLSDNEIKGKIADLLKHSSKSKLLRYSKKYNRTVHKFVKDT